MNPAADRFRVFCLGMALLLSPALLLAFPSLPVIQADEKQEKAAEKAFDELNEKMNQAQEAYYRPMSEAREKGLSSKEMEKIELDPNLEPGLRPILDCQDAGADEPAGSVPRLTALRAVSPVARRPDRPRRGAVRPVHAGVHRPAVHR